MKRFDFEALKHSEECGSKVFLAIYGHGCCARGTDYIVQCTKCDKMIKVGKNPGRKEYFSGTEVGRRPSEG